MDSTIKILKKIISHFFILPFVVTTSIFAQNLVQKKETAQQVFDKLVLAYGNVKVAPLLEVLPKGNVGAIYKTDKTKPPTIKIDLKLIDLCLALKADSLNALACVLSHELSHYYHDDTFCADYEFANKDLQKISLANKIEKETIADSEGIWHAAMAGYQPFDIFNKLIDKIYIAYNIPIKNAGYPSKEERKLINLGRQNLAERLLPIFNAGYILGAIGEYEAAATCFDEVKRYFPSRENYNNTGVVKLKLAIQKMPSPAIPFIYPIEIDGYSRLNRNNATNRALDETQEKYLEKLLDEAKQNFEKAIALDPTYIQAYTNLATAYDVLGNHEAAIGKLNELPKTLPDSNSVNMLKAIAYYHNDQDKKATQAFAKLPDYMDSIFGYNKKLYGLSNGTMDKLIDFYSNWNNNKENTNIPQNIKTEMEQSMANFKNCKEISFNEQLKICSKNYAKELKIKVGNKSIFGKTFLGNDINTAKHGDFELVKGSYKNEFWMTFIRN